MTDTPRSNVERTYVVALASLMRVAEESERAREFAGTASKQLRDAGHGNDAELISALVDEAVTESGLPEDNKHVANMRAAFTTTVQVNEAIDNGVDPREARLIALLGGDPRRNNPFNG